MTGLLIYWILPVLFLLGCGALIILDPRGGWRGGGAYGLIAFLASFGLGTLAIFYSRSSTAALGFLFLPLMAMGPGLLGVALGVLQRRYRRARRRGTRKRLLGAGALAAALGLAGILGYQIYGWNQTRELNAARDAEAERQRQAIRANIDRIARRLEQSPGEEAQVIAEMAAETDDRTVLIPLADRPETPPEVLERLIRSDDFGVALSALRNDDTPAESITWLYENHSYPDYFFADMAAHPNTPVWILRELYDKRGQNTGIPRGLARNPSTPPDIREQLPAPKQHRP